MDTTLLLVIVIFGYHVFMNHINSMINKAVKKHVNKWNENAFDYDEIYNRLVYDIRCELNNNCHCDSSEEESEESGEYEESDESEPEPTENMPVESDKE